ncbi:MAG: HDOD domain-containing protein [Planctomycetes bacterium]|nr:HDOD domain-containing protein [Planctomycetota bacterium]MCB9888662.1 HDOD domain-containing protein [Planctomycetota bacterium]
MITTTEELEELVDSTVSIPTIPTVLLEMQEVLNSTEGSTADAASIIQKDPAIGAKVLRLVNSPIYGLKQPISAIPLACSILGLRVVHNLVVQATVLDSFAGPDEGNLDVQWLWDHSFKTAMAARILVRDAKFDLDMTIDDAYTGGLIHDIGKVLLVQNQPDRFGEAMKLSQERGIPLAQAEGELFGFSHAHIGGLLAQRWNLAPILQAAVMYHHSPGTNPDTWAVGFLIQSANTIAHQAADQTAPYRGDLVDSDALQALGVPPDRLEEITNDIRAVTLS